MAFFASSPTSLLQPLPLLGFSLLILYFPCSQAFSFSHSPLLLSFRIPPPDLQLRRLNPAQPQDFLQPKRQLCSLTLAESNADNFHHVCANHPRHVKELHPFVPSLPSANGENDNNSVPLLAVKVTVFPNSGLCIGFAYHHVAADGRTFDFIKTWASFNRDSSFSVKSTALYDRFTEGGRLRDGFRVGAAK